MLEREQTVIKDSGPNSDQDPEQIKAKYKWQIQNDNNRLKMAEDVRVSTLKATLALFRLSFFSAAVS